MGLLKTNVGGTPMRTDKLRPLDKKPDERKVFEATPETKGKPWFSTDGNRKYTCGTCGRLLLEKVWEKKVAGWVIHCTSCNTYNDTLPPGASSLLIQPDALTPLVH